MRENNEDPRAVTAAPPAAAAAALQAPGAMAPQRVRREFGGREGPEPTRYGDWELRGRCIDF